CGRPTDCAVQLVQRLVASLAALGLGDVLGHDVVNRITVTRWGFDGVQDIGNLEHLVDFTDPHITDRYVGNGAVRTIRDPRLSVCHALWGQQDRGPDLTEAGPAVLKVVGLEQYTV